MVLLKSQSVPEIISCVSPIPCFVVRYSHRARCLLQKYTASSPGEGTGTGLTKWTSRMSV